MKLSDTACFIMKSSPCHHLKLPMSFTNYNTKLFNISYICVHKSLLLCFGLHFFHCFKNPFWDIFINLFWIPSSLAWISFFLLQTISGSSCEECIPITISNLNKVIFKHNVLIKPGVLANLLKLFLGSLCV